MDENKKAVCPLSMGDCVMERYDDVDDAGRHPVCRFSDANTCMVENVLDGLCTVLVQLIDGWQEYPIRVEVQ